MNKIVIDDMRFRMGVRIVDGIIHAEQGMVMFYREEEGLIAPLPIPVSYEYHEQPVSVYMYNGSKKIILNLGKYDRLLDDFDEDEVDILGSQEDIYAIFEEQKIRRLPIIMGFSFVMTLGVLLAVILGLLHLFKVISMWWLFVIPAVLFLIGLLGTKIYTKVLNQQIVYDCEGNWLNFDDSTSNLYDGVLPGYERWE